ncbi:hexosaminidase [Massilia sp. MP_M2]|uniref:family 20 glycosylhydrolase n=1 Tax=Massilia sp. MP_M2 TaxID=3071713 RepID=UPI00319E41BA
MTDRSDGGPAIHIAWECLSNFIRDDAFAARLVLRNDGAMPIAPGWTLCFNTCRKILAETVSAGYAIAHVNGDLFALSMPGGGTWQPGQTHTLDYEALHWAISITDAPLGFYLLPAQGGAAVDLGDPAIAPFVRPEQRQRHRSDAVPTADAAWRFAQNAALSYLDEAEVGRITPRPRSARFTGGQYRLGRDASIVHGPGLDNEVRFLRALLADLPPGEGAVTLAIGPVTEPGHEAYSLDIDAQRVVLKGASAHGVFNGLQSLAQLVSPDGALPLGSVQDAPRYAYRGMMLDVARHFSSVDTVLRLLDCMAAYKLNRFHFHLTDDEGWRLAIAALPELTDIGAQRGVAHPGRPCLPPSFGSGAAPGASSGSGFYTAEEFVTILRYAKARHIDVIPEFNLPGHARAAVEAMRVRHARLAAAGDFAGAEEYLLSDPADASIYESVQLWHDNVMCIALPSVERFIDTVVTEVAALYRAAEVPLQVLHTGGDEVPGGAWVGSSVCQASMRAHGWTDVRELRDDFQARCRAILARHGIAFAGWEETALAPRADGVLAPDRRQAGRDVHVYVWNNGGLGPTRDCATELAAAGFDVVLANATSLYFDFAHAKHPLEPGYYWAGFVGTRDAFALAPSVGVTGLQGQLWGENVCSRARLEYLAMPRLLGLAERAWSPQATDPDWNEFANRLGRRELPRLDRHGWHYRLPPPGALVEDGVLQATTAFPGLGLHYTVDGRDPDAGSPRYVHPVPLHGVRVVKLASIDTRGRVSRIVTLNLESP